MARWTFREIRRLLNLLSQPEKLERDPLGTLLREATHEKSVHAALINIIRRALPTDSPSDQLLRSVIGSSHQSRSKSRQTAASLGLSLRSYFRYRAAAVEAVAAVIDRTLRENPRETRYEIQLAEMVAQFDPQVAFEVLNKTIDKPSGQIAYELLCSAIRAGQPVTSQLVSRCEGPWRTLAMAALGRRHLIGGQPELAQRWRNKMRRAVEQPRTPADHSAAFELAQFDRLEAIRRCDMNAARAATRQMTWHARSNSELVGLALVATAEQACDDGDLAQAQAILRRLADLNAASRDFRVMARTAHGQALVALMQGSWDQAWDLARLAAVALSAAEPAYSICAHVNVGRAALLLGREWQAPRELLKRFARSWISGMILAVESRHMLTVDPAKAARVARDAIAIAKAQDASGMLSFAQTSLAFALDACGAADQAQSEFIKAWELASRLGRQSYLYDIFVHPRMQRRSLGAFVAGPRFFDAIQRRIGDLIAADFGPLPPSDLLAAGAAIVRVVGTLVQPVGKPRGPVPVPERSELVRRVAPQLAKDIVACLPHPERQQFVARWKEATVAVLDGESGGATFLNAAS